MSVAKSFTHNGVEHWFNYKEPVATVSQLELLADLSGESLDDLLDAGLGQKQVAQRLFEIKGLVPVQVLENKRKARLQHDSTCRWCDLHGLKCEGRMTRHHYVPRWLMLQLENYNAYAPRRLCTIPICLGRHRDLHQDPETANSVVPYLSEAERKFADRLIGELREERPMIFDLIASGDETTYEGQLVRDYLAGEFRHPTGENVARKHDRLCEARVS